MLMYRFDPNECVNKEKLPVCMHWTKKYICQYVYYVHV